MRFEYNSNLDYDERVLLVMKEIMDEYPLISKEQAYVAASLSSPINRIKATNDEKFDRYYFLMLATKRESEFSHIFNDAFNLFKDGFKEETNQKIMIEIMNYLLGDRDTFPEIYAN